MREIIELQSSTEKAFLVAAQARMSRPLLSLPDSLSELTLLAKTAGMDIVGQATQLLSRIDPATFIGSGKVEEIKLELEMLGAGVIIFDDELSPRHQRELEKRFGENIKIIDRSALILDIFAQHAHTREGALQVELAQYEYRLPRLTRQWTHLARQAGGSASKGGVGLRGPGETQLEADRREIGRRISKLKSELEDVRMQRSHHRSQRERAGIPVVALVGYTNAGKSTLMNALTNADVYVADQLFATLDPTTRRLTLPSGRQVLLTDTVGFIQKLPTTLVAAFRATLEEISEADMLLHVVDVSHPNVLQHIDAVEDTLAELDVPLIPRILVWNKSDQWENKSLPTTSELSTYGSQVAISAYQKQGIDDLIFEIEHTLSSTTRTIRFLIPYSQGQILSALYESATIEKREDTREGVVVTARLPQALAGRYQQYQIT